MTIHIKSIIVLKRVDGYERTKPFSILSDGELVEGYCVEYAPLLTKVVDYIGNVYYIAKRDWEQVSHTVAVGEELVVKVIEHHPQWHYCYIWQVLIRNEIVVVASMAMDAFHAERNVRAHLNPDSLRDAIILERVGSGAQTMLAMTSYLKGYVSGDTWVETFELPQELR